MTRTERRLTLAAGAVIVVLTAAAFWLSYAHLHTVAAEHGLGGSDIRAWAWPGCLDLFIVAGELLMLRASLARRTDPWAIGLVVIGSGGSIALNVFGVDGGDPLAYVTAAVPPTAALLAFGALMRQVHTLIAEQAEAAPEAVPNTPVPAPVFAPVSDEHPVPFAPAVESAPAVPEPQVTEANTPEQAPEPTEQETAPEAPARLSQEDAREVIEQCWADGLGVRETARRATRSPSTVTAAFARLEKERGPQPVAGQLALVK
ncbi:DUF2637 domain-containing protein [Streptomyces griseoaurantiacus]|uniref:DUF2637 domain-containing protein n=1 Tax=Streptomyces griseoaurantiacus TaxID=68213 RepID=UPI0030E042E0